MKINCPHYFRTTITAKYFFFFYWVRKNNLKKESKLRCHTGPTTFRTPIQECFSFLCITTATGMSANTGPIPTAGQPKILNIFFLEILNFSIRLWVDVLVFYIFMNNQKHYFSSIYIFYIFFYIYNQLNSILRSFGSPDKPANAVIAGVEVSSRSNPRGTFPRKRPSTSGTRGSPRNRAPRVYSQRADSRLRNLRLLCLTAEQQSRRRKLAVFIYFSSVFLLEGTKTKKKSAPSREFVGRRDP